MGGPGRPGHRGGHEGHGHGHGHGHPSGPPGFPNRPPHQGPHPGLPGNSPHRFQGDPWKRPHPSENGQSLDEIMRQRDELARRLHDSEKEKHELEDKLGRVTLELQELRGKYEELQKHENNNGASTSLTLENGTTIQNIKPLQLDHMTGAESGVETGYCILPMLQNQKIDVILKRNARERNIKREYEILNMITTRRGQGFTGCVHAMYLNNSPELLVIQRFGSSLSSIPGIQSLDITKRVVIPALIYALFELHSLGVMHGDIKPQNILVDSTSPTPVKLCDLDSAAFVTKNEPFPNRDGRLKFTPSWVSPEVYKCTFADLKASLSIDLFGLGLVISWLCCGEYRDCMLPVHDPSEFDACMVDQATLYRQLRVDQQTSVFMGMVRDLCSLDPSKRGAIGKYRDTVRDLGVTKLAKTVEELEHENAELRSVHSALKSLSDSVEMLHNHEQTRTDNAEYMMAIRELKEEFGKVSEVLQASSSEAVTADTLDHFLSELGERLSQRIDVVGDDLRVDLTAIQSRCIELQSEVANRGCDTEVSLSDIKREIESIYEKL